MTDYRTHVSNVLVIGSGAAGLRAAIAATEAGSDVVIVGKSLRRDAHTVLAAGGINAVLGTVDPEDSWQQHFADTYKEGYSLADPRTVELMVKEAPAAIEELVQYGVPFARTPEGEIDQRFFGAHKWRRTCYVGDYTGRAILYGLADRADELAIPIHSRRYVSRLLVEGGICFGALAFDLSTGERTIYLADAVILATGGHTRLWRRSSSRADENLGDGMYLGLMAGVELADMELIQFHPTGMVAPESVAGTLVTEAVRGEGGHLLNANGERFMAKYDPERMELSTRDRVALANYTEIVEGRGGPHGGVFLDISHKSKELILEKIPRMYRQFIEYQMLDISKGPMEVAPTAHYSMGGIVVQPDTHATTVIGLYSAGEVTSGLHGANRLGGNSLAETVVFGRRAGEAAANYSRALGAQPRSQAAVKAAHDDLDSMIGPGEEIPHPVMHALHETMWQHCGVVRDEARMVAGLGKLAELRAMMPLLDVRPSSEGWQDVALALDLRAGLACAEATLRSALERRESRGAHQRTDYPDLDPALRVNFVVRMDRGSSMDAERQQIVQVQDVPPVSQELQAYLNDPEYAVVGRLLE